MALVRSWADASQVPFWDHEVPGSGLDSERGCVVADLERYRQAGSLDAVPRDITNVEAIIQWLEDRGLSFDEVCDGLKDEEVLRVVRNLLENIGSALSLREISERSGVSLEVLREVRIAAGLEPVTDDDRVYVESDVEAFTTLRLGSDLFSREELLSFIRVVGSSMSRVADAANSLFHGDVERPLMAAGASITEMMRRTAEAQDLALSLTSVLRMMMRQHLSQSIERHQRAFAGISRQGLMMPMAVGFIDLVGFTPLSADLDPQQLSDVVSRFEATANDTITTLGGRLVKLIGDEVMFVAVDPADGCRIAAGLLERFGADRDLNPRGGMAYGPVLARGGDYFGPTVNLAARLVDQAVPGEVLLTDELATRAPMPVEPGGRRMLKGFVDPVSVASLSSP